MKFLKLYEEFNSSIKRDAENYVDELIEKGLSELIRILGIETPEEEIDIDELRQQAVEYFSEVPDRMKITTISPARPRVGASVIPRLQNIGMN